jgi:crotonobetainyl-CoA:carnitine CoA-transferase CaiB-like acyl-CoA transferase
LGQRALEGYRALDLTDEKGFICGLILSYLGVDVIKVEPPGGDRSRMIGPFLNDIPHPERSLYWFAYNANKRGITLNLNDEYGKEIFRKLVGRSHFVIESFDPGYMDEIGLGYKSLMGINKGIILTSITPFGQDGPYRSYKASDLVAMAMGGLVYLCGDPDRPPVRISFPQAYLHGGAEAAVATLIAHYYREKTGEGQWVDCSIQQSVYLTTFNAPVFWELNGMILRRAGAWRTGLTSGTLQRQIWPCKDGYVNFPVYGGIVGAVTNRRLVEWMDSEGMADDFLKGMDWENLDLVRIDQETWNLIEDRFARFFASHTKEELYRISIERNVMLYPVSTPSEIAENEQLRARDYWVELFHPELNKKITYPGPPVKASLTPMEIRRRAPLIGEHNREVYCDELGISEKDLEILRERGVI